MKSCLKKLNVYLFIIVIVLCSCEGSRFKKYTPEEFLNHTKIGSEGYERDQNEIIKSLKYLLKNHEQSFYNKAYFDSTQLIIDTIIYNNDFNKLAVFVIVKNPTSRQLIPNKKHEWYFDATCYMGIRQNDTIKLFWLGPNFSNSYDQQELSYRIRDAYFTEFATNDTTKSSAYKYNLNDLRFWNSSVWKEVEDK